LRPLHCCRYSLVIGLYESISINLLFIHYVAVINDVFERTKCDLTA
jgi:hypothetical protein